MSERVKRVRAMFGRAGWQRPARFARVAARIKSVLRPGEVALITGPSGAGKSTIARALRSADVRRSLAFVARERVVDCFACGLEESMALLARAGLAEAWVMTARVEQLSEGQRARLEIALAMEGARELLVLDEFASTLDRPTAAALSRTVRRWAKESGVRVVCVTAHEDVMEWLGPEVLVVVGRGRVKVARRDEERRG